MGLSAVVLGDIMLDVRGFLDEDFGSAIANDAVSESEVSIALAGTGVGMARALVSHADSVHLVGFLGSDATSDLLHQLLQAEPFDQRIARKPGAGGVAVVIRDADERATHGHRLVAADRGANDQATVHDVTAVQPLIETTDLLCVDGYGLLGEPRRAATLRAMAIARAAGREVFLDLVPHDLFRHWSLDLCRRLMADATIVGTSGATLAHLLGMPWPGMRPLDQTTAATAAERATAVLGRRIYLMHYGPGHCGETLAFDDGVLWCDHTDYSSVAPEQLAGFGDRLNARELSRLLALDDPMWAA